MVDRKMLVMIENELKTGLSKKQIFYDLGKTDDLASALAAIPYYKDREKYATLNWTLVGILACVAVYKTVVSAISFLAGSLPIYLLVITLVSPAIFLVLADQVRKYRCHIVAAALCVFNLVRSLSAHYQGANLAEIVPLFFVLLLLSVGSVLGIYLKRKLCPHQGFLGARTDRNGTYLFLNEGQ